MQLTEYGSGKPLTFKSIEIGGIYDMGADRIVRTKVFEFFETSPRYKVCETVSEILKKAHEEGAKGNA